MTTFKDIMRAYCKADQDLNLQLLNTDIRSSGKSISKQDIIFLIHNLEAHYVNARITFESDLESGVELSFDGSEIEYELASDQRVVVTPVQLIEKLVNRYDVVAWIDGYNKLYTLGYGMVIYDERAM